MSGVMVTPRKIFSAMAESDINLNKNIALDHAWDFFGPTPSDIFLPDRKATLSLLGRLAVVAYQSSGAADDRDEGRRKRDHGRSDACLERAIGCCATGPRSNRGREAGRWRS